MEKILKKVYEKQRLAKFLHLFSHFVVLLYCLGFLLVMYASYERSFISVLKSFLILSVPFVLVSIFRRALNAPRPYELYDFYEKAPKDKSGRSFPSRHAFSAFAIGAFMLFCYPVIGAVMLFFALLLCVCRVLLGIHFIRDVLAGALVGVLTSVLGALIFTPFN